MTSHDNRRRMPSRGASYLWAAGCALTLAAGAVVSAAPTAGAHQSADRVSTLQGAFTAAAHESGVPLNVLEALAYQESAWSSHGGAPSTSGAYGIMQLTDVTAATLDGLDPDSAKAATIESDPALSTARTAAKLIGADVAQVKQFDAVNIRAGAALLASYAKVLNGGKAPASNAAGAWYSAVAEYSGAADSTTAKQFADRVYHGVRDGIATPALTLPGDPAVQVDAASLSALHLPASAPVARKNATSENGTPLPECPPTVPCDYNPAVLALNDPADLSSYGNYDPADRPAHSAIRYITIHDTEGSFAGSVSWFKNPVAYASAHYVIRSSDGHVTQMVPTQDIAWDSANWSVYQHSISIEHEGWAIHGAAWYTEAQYETTAELVRFLAAKYGIPLDRQHIIGHDEVPGSRDSGQSTQHWDPGTYWDWSHFMDLLGAPIVPWIPAVTGGAAGSGAGPGPGPGPGTSRLADPAFNPLGSVVVVRPSFHGNLQVVSGCTDAHDPTPGAVPGQCGEQPSQPTNFVWLRTAPDPGAPLLSEPYLHADGSPGTDAASDWGDKAVTGQKFVVADRRITRGGLWTAIWYGGREAWFDSPWSTAFAAFPSTATVVRPKAGLTSIPVYGTAAPEASAYPPPIADVDLRTPKLLTKYSIPAGQSYVAAGPAVNGEYWFAYSIDASAPMDRTEVVGTTKFFLIQFNHRMAWVAAADVDVSHS